jgi:hypothetical protein
MTGTRARMAERKQGENSGKGERGREARMKGEER